ncbi:MAG: leucine-rich repeat protein, partial [Clostridia bacterium]|nr:leucine-rich repeat protein [Clostridia bacterium]
GSLTIYGRASTSQPDLAIEGVMNVYTSYIEAENNSVLTDASELGLYLSNTRVCDLNGAPKPIRLARTTKLTVGQHSSIGTVSAVGSLEDFNLQAVRVFVINHGTIGGIDLSAMTPYMSGYPTPRIYIPNYGIIENLANQNYHIRLPHWSRPCTMDSLSKEGSENENNTLIIRENGSHMEVQTEGNSDNRFKTENVIDAGKTVLLDKVNNDPTNIVIHYLDGKDAWGETVEGPTTIEKIIDYYTSKTTNENLKITPANVTSLKIICYAATDLSLTPDDYAAIRTLMPNLTTIDLGEAYSEDYTLPDYAFKGLANLSTLTLSEKDIQWGSQLFEETQIKTITLPLNLASIKDDTLSGITLLYARNKASVLASGSPSLLTYLAQLGESDSKYPSHTRPAITLIFGSDLARNTMIAAVENVYNEKYPAADGAYVFFRDKTTGVPNAKELNKISRMFVGTNAQIIDNYLITLNSINNQCTIHAYLGDKFDAQAQREGAHLFDFTQFRVSERETYTVIRYDSFAFFNLKLENLPNTLEFSMDLDSIGDGAFYNTNLPENVSLGGCTVVGHAALAKNTYIKNVAALELETAGYYAFGGISMNYANTPKLTYVHGYTFEYPRRLDIGLAQYAPDYKAKNPGYNTLTGPSSGMFDSTVVIHTEHYDY